MTALLLLLSLAALPPEQKLREALMPNVPEDERVRRVTGRETPSGILVNIETEPAQREQSPGPCGMDIGLVDPKTLKEIGNQVHLSTRGGFIESCSAGDEPIVAGSRMLFEYQLSSTSDGEGSLETTVWVLLEGTRLSEVLRIAYVPSNGDGYPHTSETVTVKALTRRTNGMPDFAEARERSECSDPDKCQDRTDNKVWRFDGRVYRSDLRAGGDSRIASVTASSFLVEKKQAPRFYGPEQATDGIAETAWVEGVKGPGIGEYLSIVLRAPVTVTSMTVLAGCGVNDALWKKNHRIKKLKVALDRAESEVTLQDVHEEQTVPLSAKGPVQTITLTIADVFKGTAFDDACISEVRFK